MFKELYGGICIRESAPGHQHHQDKFLRVIIPHTENWAQLVTQRVLLTKFHMNIFVNELF